MIKIIVKLTIEPALCFRIDGDSMLVNWGDGEKSELVKVTGHFSHHYNQTGKYTIVIQGENITAIDMPNCYCIELEVSDCKTLEFINCSNNQLPQLEVNHCKRLYELQCNNNSLEYLNVNGLDKLFYLSCSSNKLKSLRLQDCRDLVNLYCSKNFLKTLDLRRCKKLVVVKAEENAFDKALLDLISSLKYKFRRATGLVGISGMLSECSERVHISITEKGWCEI